MSGLELHLRRVLVPTDTSPVSCKAVRVAELLCRDSGAELRLLHVTPCPPSPAGLETAATEVEVSRRELVILEAMVADLRSRGLKAHLRSVVGYPSDAILSEIPLEHADLVILATHGAEGMERLVFGSTAEAVLRGTACPVITLGPQVSDAFGAFTGPVLFATDFREDALQAAHFAASWAKGMHADLRLVHVLPSTLRGVTNTVVSAVLREALERLLKGGDPLGTSLHSEVLYADDVAGAIVASAAEHKAQTIVLGVRRGSLLANHLPPGKVYRILMNAPCPVLTLC